MFVLYGETLEDLRTKSFIAESHAISQVTFKILQLLKSLQIKKYLGWFFYFWMQNLFVFGIKEWIWKSKNCYASHHHFNWQNDNNFLQVLFYLRRYLLYSVNLKIESIIWVCILSLQLIFLNP